MLTERLEQYYGLCGSEEREFIGKMTANCTVEEEDKLYERIVTGKTKKGGFPDISFLSRVFSDGLPRKSAKHCWCVCDRCGAEYAYGMMLCPKCYEKGVSERAYHVRVSDSRPSASVISYNKEVPDIDGEMSCYRCEKRNFSYCQNFGRENFSCREEDFFVCRCRQCCLARKKQNRMLWEKHSGK